MSLNYLRESSTIKREDRLIRPLFVKGLSNRECARIANTSTGSVSKEILEMKKELARAEGIPITQAHKIKAERLRECFYDDPFKYAEKPKKIDDVHNPQLTNTPPSLPVKSTNSEKVFNNTGEIAGRSEVMNSVEIIT